MKDRDDSDSESDSESDSSDDDLAVNPQFDEDFYKTLASLKQKDPIIYNKNTRFFDEAIEEGNASVKEKKAKALTVKDYERKVLLEKGGIYEDDEEDGAGEADRPSSPTYVEEQKSLKNEFKKIIHGDSDEEEGGDWGGIFKKREKTKEEAVSCVLQQTQYLYNNTIFQIKFHFPDKGRRGTPKMVGRSCQCCWNVHSFEAAQRLLVQSETIQRWNFLARLHPK